MTSIKHRAIDFVGGLSSKLATRSRHVCAFLGAGVGSSCKLPDVEGLKTRVVESLEGDTKVAFQRQLDGRNFEQALTRVRRVAALLSNSEQFDGLSQITATRVDKEVCSAVVRALDLEGADLSAAIRFAAWSSRADYRQPLELFTVNYDLLLETALEAIGVPYFDGFCGTLRAGFRPDLIEGKAEEDRYWMPRHFVRLWKLHGSVNWAKQKNNHIVRLGTAVTSTEDEVAAIHPSDTKYEESRRVPFIVLQDRFRRSLLEPETLLLISGYSFSDGHLNEQIFDAASKRERSEFIVFCYSDIPEELAAKAPLFPNLQAVAPKEAIIGGARAGWEAPSSDFQYVWENGAFVMSDFGNLARHLARSISRESEIGAPFAAPPSNASPRAPEKS